MLITVFTVKKDKFRRCHERIALYLREKRPMKKRENRPTTDFDHPAHPTILWRNTVPSKPSRGAQAIRRDTLFSDVTRGCTAQNREGTVPLTEQFPHHLCVMFRRMLAEVCFTSFPAGEPYVYAGSGIGNALMVWVQTSRW